MVDSQKKRVRHQLAATWDKIVRVIAKQSLFDCFFKLTCADKILALIRDKSQTSSGEIMVDALYKKGVSMSHVTFLYLAQTHNYQGSAEQIRHLSNAGQMVSSYMVCDTLLKRNEIEPFLKRIITGDEQ